MIPKSITVVIDIILGITQITQNLLQIHPFIYFSFEKYVLLTCSLWSAVLFDANKFIFVFFFCTEQETIHVRVAVKKYINFRRFKTFFLALSYFLTSVDHWTLRRTNVKEENEEIAFFATVQFVYLFARNRIRVI